MIMLSKITTFFVIGGVLANAASLPALEAPLQYGALGLCILTMYLHQQERQRLVGVIDKKDDQLIEVMEKNSKVLNRIAEGLADRPCLQDESMKKKLKDGSVG